MTQRIGINTGVVFAGQVGTTRRREYSVMGQPVNLAARLMAAAEEGAISLSPATRRSVERHIAVRELPPIRLKGVAEPVAPVEALHPFEIVQEARRAVMRPALVGRAAELDRMIGQARAALNGSGRVVALVGEAGVGKTRLVEEALYRLVLFSGQREAALPAFFPYSVECQSYDQSTPYAAIRELLRQFFNLGPAADQPYDPTGLLRQVQELAPGVARFAPLLGDLLGLPLDDTPLTAALTPEQRHDRAQELVETLLLAESRRQPLILIVDDLHWADASSLELLARVARRTNGAALLIIFGYRLDPPIAEPWCELEHCLRMHLRELSQEGTSALVRALLRGEPPPELAVLIEKAQGNPFFVEEVVRGMVESGALQQDGEQWRLTHVVDEAAIPDSIEGVITARLDRIEDRSREILQVASVIGRRFPYPVLSGIMLRSDDLLNRLDRLSEAELILPEEIERDLSYLFKHALTRDVAYEAILYARRRELHRRVARQIEQIYPDRLDEQLALLARHYLLAEEWAPAFDYHLRAGRHAQEQFANREAITLYERALQIAPHLKATTAVAVRMIELLERLGVVHALIGEYDAALGRYEEALARQQQLPDAPVDELVRLHHHIARVYEKRAQFETAFEWIERAMALAADASAELARCYLLGAGLYQRQGRYAEALKWAQHGLEAAEQRGSSGDMAHAYYLICGTYRNLGQHQAAAEMGRKSLALYQERGDLIGQADAQNTLANVLVELGMNMEAAGYYRAALQLKEALGDVYGQALIANNLGDLLRKVGDDGGAMEQFAVALHKFESLGSQYGIAVLHMNIGSVSLIQNNLAQARHHLDRSRELFEEIGAEDFLAELYRYYAELALAEEQPQEALVYADESLELAQRLDARAEAGATLHIRGLILHALGRQHEARAALLQARSIYREVGNQHKLVSCLEDLAGMLDDDEEATAILDEARRARQEVGGGARAGT